MSTQSLAAAAPIRHARPKVPPAARSTLLEYQLNVIAADIGDVVQSVGGWLFDRSAEGWKVNVSLVDRDDTRPLRILGARTSELDHTLLSIDDGAERATGLAIASALLGTDESIYAELRDALRCGDVEIALWGDDRFVERVGSVQYRLSNAARVFKAEALAAAGVTDVPVTHFETLFRSGYRPVDSHLIPAS